MKRHILHALVGILFSITAFATVQASNMSSSCNDDGKKPIAARQLRGDVNGDGERTIVDVTILVNYILTNQADFELRIGDLDGDNSITIIDITIMVNIILGADYDDPDNPDLDLDGPEGGDPGTGL